MGDERSGDQLREVQQPWRAWYRSVRWRKLRMQVFIRDKWTCQRSGVIVAARSPSPDSAVAHHKIPHRGDPRLFWDVNNVETIAKSVHDQLIQAEERAFERNELLS